MGNFPGVGVGGSLDSYSLWVVRPAWRRECGLLGPTGLSQTPAQLLWAGCRLLALTSLRCLGKMSFLVWEMGPRILV